MREPMPKYYRNDKKDRLIKSILTMTFFIAAVIIGYVLYDGYQAKLAATADNYTICSFDYKDTLATVEADDYSNPFEIKDYLYYGETLNLFQDDYDIQETDGLVGRTIMLTNLCTGDEMVYLINGNIDSQIPVESLDDGFYSVKIVYDLTQRRAYSEDVINNVFYTVRRDGQCKEVRLIADQSLFDDDENTGVLDRNYLFIEVTTVDAPDEVYDIVLDPGHSSEDDGYTEYGGIANGLVEADETYKIALVIKERLESYGLKVLITRKDASEVLNTYGEDGRLDRAYASEAKYYFDLQMAVASDTDIRGSQIVYSSFTSAKMATAIFDYLLENTDLVSTGYTGTGKISGVVPSGVVNGYDGRMVIRESGGRILGAGTFSEKAIEENASFAQYQRCGLQTFTISYIYVTNPTEAAMWTENYVEYGNVTADAIAEYLGLLDE